MVEGLAISLALLLFLPSTDAALLDEGSSPLVLAFYYNWFDENTWTSEKVSDFPVTLYNSGDRETVVRHIAQAQEAGLDAFVVAWYGPQVEGNPTEPNLALMLEVADGTPFQVSVEFGPDSPFIHSQPDVVDALRHVLQVHAQHPSFLRAEGRPVIFFWRLDSIPLAPEQTPLEAWQAIREQVDPDHESIWIAEGVEVEYQQVFDGHHLYSIAWSEDVHQTLSDWGYRIRRYNAQHGTDKLWVATVMPGYNDLKGRADAFVREREDGQFYRDTWQAAMDSGADWVVITSWNEWVEGSQIEPSVSYGNLYLDLTRELAAQFRAQAEAFALATPTPTLPSPTVAVTITPTATRTPKLTATSTPTVRLSAHGEARTPSPTAIATPKSTPTATATSTPLPTATATASPTATPTTNPTLTPTATPTPAPPVTPLRVAAYASRCLGLAFLGGAIVVVALLVRDWRKLKADN
jgi:hypothetical protein